VSPETQNASQEEFEPDFQVPAEKPLLRIDSAQSWTKLDLRELWSFKELFYFLIWRDVKIRYKQTFLGVLWAVLQPVCSMLLFTMIFGRFAKIPSDGVPYPIFAFAGLLPWLFFANAVTTAGNSVVGSAHLITKIYFPRILIPAATVGAGLVELGIGFLVLLILLLRYGVAVSFLSFIMVPALILLTTILATSVGTWMAALNVKFRDVRFALPFIVQLWFFASPVVYPSSMIKSHAALFRLNPMVGIIEGLRCALFGRPYDWTSIEVAVLVTAVAFILSTRFFRKMEQNFADVI
jgi:lipopolysaccharide transport system permease protein